MRKLLIYAVCVVMVVSSARMAYAQRSDRYVVILSVDAFRWDLTKGAHTPTFDSLRRVGTYAETYPCFPANTFPNHYAMATGLHPDHHGIVNNTFYDRKLNKKYSMGDKSAVADPDFWHGEPIWNTVERQGLLANIFMWVGSETRINGRQPSVWTPYSNKESFYTRAGWVVDAMTQHPDSIPNLVMWYFEEPDAVEHKYSPNSPQTRATVEHIDSVLCYFFREIRRSPVFDKIDFIITADHGMSSLSPRRYINLYSKLDRSRIREVIGGTPLYIDPEPEYMQECYQTLADMSHLEVFRRDSMPYRYRYGSDTTRIMPLIVVPKSGWVVDYREVDRPKSGGGHGYDPFDRDMHMIFYGSGPDFKQNYTHPMFQNVHIYNILAYLLEVQPAPNDGDIGIVEDMFTRVKPSMCSRR